MSEAFTTHISMRGYEVDANGHVAAITNVGGVLDLEKRRLVADPGTHWRAVAEFPAILGMPL